jgi:hypothetical protein
MIGTEPIPLKGRELCSKTNKETRPFLFIKV